jgi:hypothetical protein
MLGLEMGQVNEGAEVAYIPKRQLVKNLDSTY